ncbi:MAG: hypothetical protein V7K27_13090 [Nostoc sp.]
MRKSYKKNQYTPKMLLTHSPLPTPHSPLPVYANNFKNQSRLL